MSDGVGQLVQVNNDAELFQVHSANFPGLRSRLDVGHSLPQSRRRVQEQGKLHRLGVRVIDDLWGYNKIAPAKSLVVFKV